MTRYAEEPVLEGFWDSLKSAASRLKKTKPLQVIAREAGVDPRGTLDVVPPQTSGFGGGSDMNTLLLWGAAIWFLTKKKGR